MPDLIRSHIDRPLLAFVAHIRAKSKGEVSPFIAFRKLRKAGALKIKDRQIYVTDTGELERYAKAGR